MARIALILYYVFFLISSNTFAICLVDSTKANADTIHNASVYQNILSKAIEPSVAETMFSKKFRKSSWQSDNYQDFNSLLLSKYHAIPFNLGFVGQWNGFSIYGADAQNVGVNFQNRAIHNQVNNFHSLDFLSTEAFSAFTILEGSQAVVQAENSQGNLILLEESTFDTKNPYTRIWYSQSGYELIQLDGIYSQNVSGKSNLHIGFKSVQSATGRYSNQSIDMWQLRTQYRHLIDSTTSLSFNHFFTNIGLGTNGGVIDSVLDLNGQIVPQDIENNVTAQVLYPTMNERWFRNESTITFNTENSEYSSKLRANIFASWYSIDRFREVDNIDFSTSDSSSLLTSSLYTIGSNLRVSTQISFAKVFAGADISYLHSNPSPFYNQSNSLNSSAFVSLLLSEDSSTIKPSVSGKIAYFNDETLVALGGSLQSEINVGTIAGIDISFSERAKALNQDATLKSESHFLALGKLKSSFESFTLEATLFYRSISNPIFSLPKFDSAKINVIGATWSNKSTRDALGSNINLMFRSSGFDCSLYSNFTFVSRTDGSDNNLFPFLFGGFKVSKEILKTTLNFVQVGCSAQLRTQMMGTQYLPLSWSVTPSSYEQPFAFSGGDVFAVAKIGNAFVKLTYQNIFPVNHTFVSIYPQIDRNLVLSVAWSFFD